MPTAIRNTIRREVLNYLRHQTAPVRMSSMAHDLRSQHRSLAGLRDEDFIAVVQPMIVTGKVSYAPGLKIKVDKTA